MCFRFFAFQLSVGDMPLPPPTAEEMQQNRQQPIRQQVRQSMQAAAIEQLDSVVSMPLPPPNHHPQQQQSAASDVDITSLQPSPMDQLKSRVNIDPTWAPTQYIQKG